MSAMIHRRANRLVVIPTTLAFFGALAFAPPSAAEEEHSQAVDALVKTADVVAVRPFAVIQLVAGGALFVPTALIVSPGGRDQPGERGREHADRAGGLRLPAGSRRLLARRGLATDGRSEAA